MESKLRNVREKIFSFSENKRSRTGGKKRIVEKFRTPGKMEKLLKNAE